MATTNKTKQNQKTTHPQNQITPFPNALWSQDQELYSFSIQHHSDHPSSPVIYSCSELIRHQEIRVHLYKKRRNIKEDELVGSLSLSASDKEMEEIKTCS